VRKVSKKDIKNLCKAQMKDFRKHLRPSMNEWMLEDFDEWYDQLNLILEKDRQRGIIDKALFQSWLAMAQEFRVEIYDMIQKHEKDEDYVARLCGIEDA